MSSGQLGAGRVARSFGADKSGSAAIIFGLSFIPVMLVMGAAVDYRNAAVLRTRLQTAVDSASVAIATSPPELGTAARQQIAVNIVNAKLGPSAGKYGVTVTTTEPAPGRFQVRAVGAVSTSVMRFAQFDNIAVSAASTAMSAETTVSSGGAGCVLSLADSVVENAIWYNGNADVRLKNCDIYGNSAAADALEVQGSATLHAQRISVVGSVQGTNKIVAEEIKTGQPMIQDPYRDVPYTLVKEGDPCNKDGFSTSVDKTLEPGIYCNGLAINSTAKVHLSPGLYIIDRGEFKVNGQAKVTGDGVTILFTSRTGSDWARATINGGAEVELAAPKMGATLGIPGIVFFGSRAMAVGTEFRLNGGSTQRFKGAIYLPEAKVKFAGGSDMAGNCTQLIADTMTFIGNSNIAIEGCGEYGVKSFGYSTVRTVRIAQ